MTGPGLNNRLRQHSRRSGLMVGISMALTIAVLIVSFSYIFRWADAIIGDFVDTNTPVPTRVASRDAATTTPAPKPSPTQEGDASAPEPTKSGIIQPFTADYLVSTETGVIMRSEPSRTADGVAELPAASQLQYLGETREASESTDGARWLKFRTEDGTEGWIREVDVLSLTAGG